MVMGTFASITLSGPDARHADAYGQTCRHILSDLAARLSVYNPDSELSRVNAHAGGAFVRMEASAEQAVRAAVAYSALTGGAFDPTVAPLVRLWGFSGGTTPENMPSDHALAERLALVGVDGVEFSEDGIRLSSSGAMLDLGGIAKGFGVDRCYEALIAAGARNFMINLGGNIRCSGFADPSRRREWTIGVRNPFDRNAIVGSLVLHDGDAVATSGNYERFVEIDGRRYAHIIDPRDGMPVHGMAGVTIVAETAVAADALSTGFFVMATNGLIDVLERTAEVDCVLIVPDRHPLEILVFDTTARFEPLAAIVGSVRPLPSPDRSGLRGIRE
jgi:thiamine biosynthesis lipoprotein